MTNLQRISLSLLISIVLVTAFTFLAYSGLFEYIETSFYHQRVAQVIEKDVDYKAQKVEEFNELFFSRFSNLLDELEPGKTFEPNWDREYIFRQNNLFEKLSEDFQGFLFARFVDTEGRIHYSTRDADIENQGQYRTIYKKLDETTTAIPVNRLVLDSPEQGSSLYIDSTTGRLIYRFPLVDELERYRGTALFYVAKSQLERYLVRAGALEIDKSISFLEDGYLFYGETGDPSALLSQNKRWWSTGVEEERSTFEDPESQKRYVLFTESAGDFGHVGVFINQSEFELSEPLKILLVVAGGLTLFLLVLLVLSMRQDKEVILRNRLKRFQLQFIREYLENKDSVSWRQMKSELSKKKELLRDDIKQGIGKVKPEKREQLDSLIDESWNDIFQVLDKRIEEKSSTNVDISNLEEVIQKILAYQPQTATQQGVSAKQTATTKTQAPPKTDSTPVPPQQKEKEEEVEALEEAEEVSEAEEAEPAEEPEEAEEAGEVEELEEVEEAEEAPAAEEAEEAPAAEEAAPAEEPKEAEEAGEAGELEELEEAEEVPEAEEAEEAPAAEEVPEAEELEEPEEAPATEEAAPAEEPEETEEAGEVEELEEVEEAEEVPEAEELEEAEEAPAAEEAAPAEEAEEAGEAGELEEVEEAEEVPEAEELEEAEEAPATEEAAPAEEAGEAGELEEVEEAEEVPEAEELEEAEEAPAAEESDEVPVAEEIVNLEVTEEAQEIPPMEEAVEFVDWMKGFRDEQKEEALSDMQESAFSDWVGEEVEAETGERERVEEQESTETVEELEEVSEAGEDEEIPEAEPAEETGQEEAAETGAEEPEAAETAKEVEELAPAAVQSSVESAGEQARFTAVEGLGTDETEVSLLERAVGGGEIFSSGIHSHSMSSLPVEGYLEVIDENEEEEIDEVEEIEPSATEIPGMAEEDDSSREEAEESREGEEYEELEEIEEEEELEEVEDLEEVEEAEELEEAEEGEETAEPAEKKSTAEVHKFSFVDLAKAFKTPDEEQEQSIVFREGTYQVDDRVYSSQKSEKDKTLQELVDEVRGEGDQERIPEEGEGIDSIVGFQSVDLPLDVIEQPSVGGAETSSSRAGEEEGGFINEEGFNYDVFLAHYGTGSLKTLKTLMRMSSKLGAVYAAILRRGDGGWSVYESVGFDKEMHGKSVVFEPGYDPLEEENENMLLYYPVEHGFRNEVPNALLREQERDYIRAAVFIPIQFEGHKDVIFLGLKREVSDIQGFVNTLDSL